MGLFYAPSLTNGHSRTSDALRYRYSKRQSALCGAWNTPSVSSERPAAKSPSSNITETSSPATILWMQRTVWEISWKSHLSSFWKAPRRGRLAKRNAMLYPAIAGSAQSWICATADARRTGFSRLRRVSPD